MLTERKISGTEPGRCFGELGDASGDCGAGWIDLIRWDLIARAVGHEAKTVCDAGQTFRESRMVRRRVPPGQ
jgi:hypothetical protein